MCRKCPWTKAAPLMRKLAEMEKAKAYREWLLSEANKIEANGHIPMGTLERAKSIEKQCGIQKRGDYDVPADRPGSSRARSGLFS